MFSSDAQALVSAWRSFESNCQFELSELFVQHMDDEFLLEAARKLGAIKELVGLGWYDCFSESEALAIEKIIHKFQDDEAILMFLDEVVDKRFFELPSIFSDGTARCTGSFQVGVRNFIRFADKHESFYLIQHHKFFRAIYFPLRRLLVCPDEAGLGVEVAAGLDREVLRLLPRLSIHCERKESQFMGLAVSYPRPYHFFYDLLPVVFSWWSSRPEIISRLPSVAQLTDGDFLSVKDFFSLACVEHKFSSFQQMNDFLVENDGFFLHPGYAKRRRVEFDELDEYLRAYALGQSEIGRELNIRKKTSDIIVWAGVCAEKRSWLEARDALKQLTLKLSTRYTSVSVVVDGLTATSSKIFSESYENELSLLKDLVAEVPENIDIFNLVGATAVDKIAAAQNVDFFLTSFLTDSMYVARFGKKKGVAHGAKAAAYYDHIHTNSFFVPEYYITDLLSKSESNWAKISYSIDSDQVVDYCLEVLELPNNGEIKIDNLSDSAGRLAFKAVEDQKYFHTAARYCSINDGSVNFNRCGDAPYRISPGALYQFYMDGVRGDGGGEISLVVISHANGKRLSTDFVRLGSHKDIVFPTQAESFRLFFRLSGGGQYKLPRIRMVSFSQSRKGGRRNIEKWSREVYEYNEYEVFLKCLSSGVKGGIHTVNYHGVFLDFNFFDRGFEDLVVFFNAAVSRTPNTEMPVFSGSKAVERLKANILMVNDPCLYLDSDLSLAWYVGSHSFPLQRDLSSILSRFSARYGKRRTLFYGGSGGGFASLYYSSKVPSAIAVCCNPQTSIESYDKGSVERFLSVCFGGGKSDKANTYLLENGFTGLLGADEFKSTSRVIYLQNKNDGHHFKKHFLPYLSRIGLAKRFNPDKSVQIISENFSLIIGCDWGEGHAAAPKEIVYNVLQKLLEDEGFLKDDEVKSEMFLAACESDGYQYIRSCTLIELNGKLVASAEVDFSGLNGKPYMAWYLYHNGLRVITTRYTDRLSWEFDYIASEGVYWVIGFLKCKDVKQNLRSGKVNVVAGGGEHD